MANRCLHIAIDTCVHSVTLVTNLPPGGDRNFKLNFIMKLVWKNYKSAKIGGLFL